MGGGRDNSGAVRYYRRNGIYFRKDGKPVNYRFRNINITFEDHMALANMAEPITEQRTNILRALENRVLDKFEHPTATDRAAMTPLPQTGKEVVGFLQRMLAIDNLNDDDKVSPEDRNGSPETNAVNRLITGDIETEKGGFLFFDGKVKNRNYLQYNDMPDYKAILEQVMPQLTPENLRRVLDARQTPIIDGIPENDYLWEFETFVTNNSGESIRTYVKVHPFHSNDGKPYAVLVGLHRTAPMRNSATDEQRG